MYESREKGERPLSGPTFFRRVDKKVRGVSFGRGVEGRLLEMRDWQVDDP